MVIVCKKRLASGGHHRTGDVVAMSTWRLRSKIGSAAFRVLPPLQQFPKFHTRYTYRVIYRFNHLNNSIISPRYCLYLSVGRFKILNRSPYGFLANSGINLVALFWTVKFINICFSFCIPFTVSIFYVRSDWFINCYKAIPWNINKISLNYPTSCKLYWFFSHTWLSKTSSKSKQTPKSFISITSSNRILFGLFLPKGPVLETGLSKTWPQDCKTASRQRR